MYPENGHGRGGHPYGSGPGGQVDRLVVGRQTSAADNGDFDIENGVLTFKSSPDFEVKLFPKGGENNDNTYVVWTVSRHPTAETVAEHDRYGRIDH